MVHAEILLTLGSLFLVGLLADVAGRHSPLPRVTLLLVAGFVIGPSVLGWLPDMTNQWFPLLTDIALAMIGFLLGGRFTRQNLARLGRSVLAISSAVVIGTVLIMASVLIVFGVAPPLALLLGGIATATAPAATVDVVREIDAQGPFTDTLLGIVAIDDAWGLILFSLLLAFAQALYGHGGALGSLLFGLQDVLGAVVLGALAGVPLAYLTGRIRPGEPTQAEALGAVLVVAGLAQLLHVSSILTAIVLGTVVANLAKHHERPFHAIEGIEWPFLILFFLLAGASLQVEGLAETGVLAAGYIVLRVIGRVLGTGVGGWLAGTPVAMRRWMGVALLPQAGIALGMALLAAQRFPELRDTIVPVVLVSTVVFELLGPVATRRALVRMGEAGDVRDTGA